MTKLSWCCTVALVVACLGLTSERRLLAADVHVAQATDTVVRVFAAMQRGDVQTLQQYLSPELYEQYRILFEQNTEYPAFLSKYYQGAKLRIMKIAKVGDRTQVQAAIDFPTGTTRESKILLKRNNAQLQILIFSEE